MPSPLISRAIVAPALLATGALALPISAYFLDTKAGGENLILPAQFAVNAGVGAALGAALPAIAGSTAGKGKGALVGAAAGLVAAAIADVGWFLLIAG